MMEQKIRNMFKQEWEIPDEVETKMQEAYRWIGAEKDAIMSTKNRKHSWSSGRWYLKAASIVAAVLLIGTTATAAATGFNFGLLKNLFGNDAKLVKQSSSKPEVSVGKGELDHLKIEMEGISGTEEVTYIMLHLKRTDGEKFKKNARYAFEEYYMESEEDLWKQQEGLNSWGNFRQSDVVTENKGTSDLRMTLVCGLNRMVNGVGDHHSGEKYTLYLGNLRELPKNIESEDEGSIVAEGKAELSFVLDYEDAVTVKKKTNVKILFPDSGKKKQYVEVGKLKEVILTPYYVKYVTEHKDVMNDNDDHDPWQEIYLEMDDGSKMGFMTEEEYDAYINSDCDGDSHLGGFASGVYNKAKKVWRDENIIGFPKLIDVKHVKAVYFGKTRIEID